MDFEQSLECRDVMKGAFKEALRYGLPYIDIKVVLWQIFVQKDSSIGLFPKDDYDSVLDFVFADIPKFVKGKYNPSANINLTKDAEYLFKFANEYRKAESEPCLEIYHILFAILSYDNKYCSFFKNRGWVFENYRDAIDKLSNIPVVTKKLAYNYQPLTRKLPPGWLLSVLPQKYRKRLVRNFIIDIQYLRQFGKYEASREKCALVLKIEAKDHYAISYMTFCFMKEKKYQEAIAFFDSAKMQDPNSIINLANCYMRIGDYKKSITLLNGINPKTATVYNNMGFSTLLLGNFKEAIRCFDEAIRMDSEYAFAWNNKGFCLFQLGEIEEGRRSIMHSLSLDRGNAYSYRNLAIIAISDGTKDIAMEVINKALLYYYRRDFGDDIDELIRQAQALP